MTSSDLADRLEALRTAAREVLAPASRTAIALRLSRLSARWLDRSDPFRAEAETLLERSTGFSPPMVRRALDETFGALVAPALPRLAGVVTGARTTLVVAGGVIPDPIVRAIYRALLGQSAVLVKASSVEPHLPAVLARSAAAIDPGLGRCLGAARWTGGDRAVESPLVSIVDRIVAYGSDEAIRDLGERVPPGVEFVGRGHRTSVAAIGRGALAGPEALEDLGRRLALDVALYDQEGCLSPHAAFVEEGGAATPADLAERVADHLDRLARILPPGRLSDGRALRLHEERTLVELSGGRVHAGPRLAWTVTLEPALGLRPSPGSRFLRIVPVRDLSLVPPILASAPLQAIAVAPHSMATAFASFGDRTRICPVGTMQTPPVEWLER